MTVTIDNERPVHYCSRCEEGIYAGERFFETYEAQYVCEICYDDMTKSELFKAVGAEFKRAEV